MANNMMQASMADKQSSSDNYKVAIKSNQKGIKDPDSALSFNSFTQSSAINQARQLK